MTLLSREYVTTQFVYPSFSFSTLPIPTPFVVNLYC